MSNDYAVPLRVSAERSPDSVAFIYRDQRLTYRDLDRTTDRLAAALEERGLSGQKVVTLLPNEPMTVVVTLALARAGAVAVPINPRLLLNEIAFMVEDSGASAIIADAAFLDAARQLQARLPAVARVFSWNESSAGDAERIEDLVAGAQREASVEVNGADIATVLYTSGTTGFPKGVVRTHDANLWSIANSQLGQERRHDDVELYVLPLFGVAFLFQVMPMILAGGTVVLDGAFDPGRAWTLLEEHRVTRVFLAPTMLDSMFEIEDNADRDVTALRIINTAYEFPVRVREQAAKRFGNIIAYMYGLTEAQLCCSTPAEFSSDPSNAGLAMGIMRIRVVDGDRRAVAPGVVGEITMQGPSLMSGYLGREQATAEALVDGWLHTGDLGYLDERGRVHFTGRMKEVIKTGGLSVDPVEVENVILAFPGVREAAVVGLPNDHWGEQVVAFIVASTAVQALEEELVGHVRSQVAGFKCPKRIWFLDELPRNPTGKVQRGRLRAEAGVIVSSESASQ